MNTDQCNEQKEGVALNSLTRKIKIYNNINKCKLFMIVMSSWNTNNNQSILEGLIRPQLTERNQLM